MARPDFAHGVRIDAASVLGWGVDADPENDPTWPIRNREKQDRQPGARPSRQPQDVEVLVSIEYKDRPAVFGAGPPPSGLSGVLRRRAFKFSESRWTHWLMLMGADRINVAEGILEDIRRGQAINLFKELGLGAEWKYDRPAAVRRSALLVALPLAALAIRRVVMRKRRPSSRAGHGLHGARLC